MSLDRTADLDNILENFGNTTQAILDLENKLVESSYEVLNELLHSYWDIVELWVISFLEIGHMFPLIVGI